MLKCSHTHCLKRRVGWSCRPWTVMMQLWKWGSIQVIIQILDSILQCFLISTLFLMTPCNLRGLPVVTKQSRPNLELYAYLLLLICTFSQIFPLSLLPKQWVILLPTNTTYTCKVNDIMYSFVACPHGKTTVTWGHCIKKNAHTH